MTGFNTIYCDFFHLIVAYFFGSPCIHRHHTAVLVACTAHFVNSVSAWSGMLGQKLSTTGSVVVSLPIHAELQGSRYIHYHDIKHFVAL